MFSKVIHIRSNNPGLALCGNYGVFSFEDENNKATCKSCIKWVNKKGEYKELKSYKRKG